MEAFFGGFEKRAADADPKSAANPEGHKLRRVLLGLPLSAAIEAEKGKKGRAAWEGFKHTGKETGKGLGLGAAGGAALGGAIGALRRRPGAGAAMGALHGGSLGVYGGALKGTLDRKGSEIHGRYSKHK